MPNIGAGDSFLWLTCGGNVAMDGNTLRGLFLDFAKASRVLDKEETEMCAKLAEVAKEHLMQRAKEFVRNAQGGAVLLSYQSDSTPLLAKRVFVARHSSGQAVVRKAGRALELLLERVFLKTETPSGQMLVECFFRDPVPLDNGKGAWPCFSAACECFPLLKKMGHHGIAISHYGADRALQSSLERLMRQRHGLFHEVSGADDSSGGGLATLDSLTDWIVSTGCANHDAQNALKWGLAGLECGDEVTKKLHIVVESLRNGYDLLQTYLPKFLTQSLTLVADDGATPGHSEEFWASMCVEPAVLQDLVELGLRWRKGRLQIYESAASKPDFVEKVTACMLSVFRFKRFTDSRWCTIGDSCRSLFASLALGLSGLVALVRSEPKTSDFYIGGFSNFDSGVALYTAVASVVANVCDAFLLALLEDDRVIRRLQELKDLVTDEVEWLINLSEVVWQDLAGLLTDVSAQQLRSLCMLSALTVQAFIQWKVFQVAESLPWSLAVGDIEENLRVLRASKDDLDSTSSKIRALLQGGYPEQRIVAAIRLMSEVSWSTTSVEQGHGSAATLHRVHKQYGANTLCMRSMVHMMRHLAAPPPMQDPLDAKLAKKEAALERSQPQKITGRQAFLKDFMYQAKLEHGSESWSRTAAKKAFARHGSFWSALSPELKAKYEYEAQLQKSASYKELADELQGLRAARHLLQSRNLESECLKASLFRLANCRFSDQDFESMALLWDTEDFAGGRLQALRDKAMKSPSPPAPSIVNRLSLIDVSEDTVKPTTPSPWVATLCRLRSAFRECALVLRKEGQEDRAYAFLFAYQSPFKAELLPLKKTEPPLPCPSSAAEMLECLNKHYEHTFTFEVGTAMNAMEVPFDDSMQVLVLPHLSFVGGYTMAAHSQPVPILDFVRSSLADGHRPAPRAQAYKPPTVDRSLVEEFPWLASYMPKARDLSSAASSKGANEEKVPKALGLDDEEIDRAFEALQEKRAEWHSDFLGAVGHFKVCLLGGAWTMEHTGMVCDAVKAYASGKDVKSWCSKYGLPNQARFGIRKFGQEQATALAETWCSHLQRFYDHYLAANMETFEYAAYEVNAPPLPKAVADMAASSQIFRERLEQIRAMAPKVGALGSASSSAAEACQ